MKRHTSASPTLRLSAALVGALATSCTIDAGGHREVEPEQQERDGGCGAGRTPGTVEQSCTYDAVEHDAAVEYYGVGRCEAGDADHITCEYTGNRYDGGRGTQSSRCRWQVTSSEPDCAGALPGVGIPLCNDFPPVSGSTASNGAITLDAKITRTIELPEGETICDSKRTQAELDAYCSGHVPKEVKAELEGLCGAIPTETKTREITCCVRKDGKGCGDDTYDGSTGLDDEAELEVDAPCETDVGPDADAVEPDADGPAPA